MDNSGSLRWNGQRGFADEKTFITSLLSKVKIAKPATRVAVIRFGTHATIDINYISDLNGLNNKCEFDKAFANIHYTGVMTNMNGAFSKVEEILFGAQSTNVRPWKVINPQGTYVNKVMFLLTDGEYNNGGDPTSKIINLKNNHVELFAVGVSGVNQAFMKNAATTQKHYFYASDFTSFRELATHIRGDPYQKDYDAEKVPKSKCSVTCDTNAECGCGLLSGRYVCICHAGYFGTGEQGKCTACTPGTYKRYPGLAQKSCTSCPDNSGHNKHGSISINDCVCNKGYEGNPASGAACTIKKCLVLPVPENGYTNPTACGRDYGSTCSFNCNHGFELMGEVTRTCSVRDNNVGRAFWLPSEASPSCQSKK
ncbi:sushi, von Willebrand factor type A, EGF and pentraxin domain-containing protein 1-like [Dendronephthya gigantea]|uniref:sushi, von Willebrand factor type A, EGF and pentraxin domain-containing protein 1-like n=1 Tax=Dendronephthya gigantea TaxID=151771 RepID=UPI00106BE30C|nr:sushi, von Willebrand factor type A, EGF and pentraxin domain-containing protein 1-like [Dendronephthya gigantea]